MSIEADVKNNSIQITISTEYLKRAFELGITTNSVGKVKNSNDMLLYFCSEIKNYEDDSLFGRFIDNTCEKAIENGESFVDIIDC